MCTLLTNVLFECPLGLSSKLTKITLHYITDHSRTDQSVDEHHHDHSLLHRQQFRRQRRRSEDIRGARREDVVLGASFAVRGLVAAHLDTLRQQIFEGVLQQAGK